MPKPLHLQGFFHFWMYAFGGEYLGLSTKRQPIKGPQQPRTPGQPLMNARNSNAALQQIASLNSTRSDRSHGGRNNDPDEASRLPTIGTPLCQPFLLSRSQYTLLDLPDKAPHAGFGRTGGGQLEPLAVFALVVALNNYRIGRVLNRVP